MVHFLPALVLSLVLMNSSAQSLRVMSYNIRYDNPADGLNAWSNRKGFLADQVRIADPDILGVQESLPHQIQYLAAALPGYDHAGVGRDENGAGESTTIFFKKDRFEMTELKMFWLSDTPEVMSKGWDAAIRRICTYVRLKDKESGRKLLVLNTHFDHVGVEARKKSAELIVSRIAAINTSGDPVVLLGDFNATPESEPVLRLRSSLSDARDVARESILPQQGSFNGFDSGAPAANLIDHIFVSKDFSVTRFAMLVESKEGRYPSDHFPVVAELELSQARR